MSYSDSGKIINKAKAQNMTPKQYCRLAVDLHGNVFRAAMALGVSPNAIRHHLNKPEKGEPKKEAACSS